MATLSQAAGIVACNGIVDLLDAGNQAARFLLTDTDGGGGTTLAAISLDATEAFGTAVNNGGSTGAVATLDVSPVPTATASATGTAAGFALQSMNSGTPTSVISGSVDIASNNPDVDVDNTSITSGQTVNLTSLTVTVPYAP